MTRAMLVVALTVASGPAFAQTAPSGVLTPAPVPQMSPSLQATGGQAAIPELIAPPAGSAAPANAAPFSNGPSGADRNLSNNTPNSSK